MGTVHNHPTRNRDEKFRRLIRKQGYYGIKLQNARDAYLAGLIDVSEVIACEEDVLDINRLIMLHGIAK